MRTKFNGILTLLLALVVQISFAQDKTISGTVSDESGTLPGVTVLKKGTTQGTETDFDGNYSIKAKTGDILVFSFVGMKTAERTVGASNQISVVLEGDNLLEEVVVVGYGTATKQSFTGTAKVVKTEDIAAKNTSNLSQALAGEIAGVQVINTSGQPGSVSTIRIRGFGSVNGNRSPLYVVDGVPYSGSLNAINPEDVATSTVLKDATATAIYGARGANGVILITTKGGKKNSSSIEVDVKTGVNFSLIPRYDVIKSSDKYLGYAWESIYNQGVITGSSDPVAFANQNLFSTVGIAPKYNMFNTSDVSQIIDPTTRSVRPGATKLYEPENWEDFAFQPAIRTDLNLKLSGGSDISKYYASVGYLDDQGYSLNSDYKRYSTRLNLTQDVKPWLTSNMNLGYAYSTQNRNGGADGSSDSSNVFNLVDNMPSIYPLFLRDTQGNFVADDIFGGNQYDYGAGREFFGLTNGIGDAINNINRRDRHELNANFSLNFNLAEGLSFKTQYGLQYWNRVQKNYSNPFYGPGVASKGSLFLASDNAVVQNFLKLLKYEKQFGSHNIQILAAHENNSNTYKRATDSKNTIVVPGLLELSNFINGAAGNSYKDESSLESYFTQLNYNYDDTYYLSASLRRDGSSRFTKNKWDTFGSIGASWIVSNEAFMQSQSTVDFLKLKASYGLIGEQSGVGLYPSLDLFNISNQNNEISINPVSQPGNPDLTWETSKMFQVGTEVKFGKYVEANFDYYIKDTENLLFDRRAPIGLGFALFTVNDGTMRNKGFEFDITTHVINKEDLKLDFTFNGEMLNNEITTMPIDPQTNLPKVLDSNGAANFGRSSGKSLYDFYMREWAGVDPADGAPMWVQYYDDKNNNNILDAGEGDWFVADPNDPTKNLNTTSALFGYRQLVSGANIKKTTTKTFTDATLKFIDKTAIPKLRGAFRLGGSYKNFDFSTQFLYSLGGYGIDAAYASKMHSRKVGSNNWHTDIENRWQKPGDITDVPRLSNDIDNNANRISTRFITSTDFLSLNNVRIGYSLPKKAIESSGISSANIWISGDNLFLLSARNGYNPSTSETGTSSSYGYAPLTNLTLGVRVKF